jgi:hypothetical protein
VREQGCHGHTWSRPRWLGKYPAQSGTSDCTPLTAYGSLRTLCLREQSLQVCD